ncbi:hypothetical protein CEK25_006558 [Fusarium fujikuroi]|nr:hypothetical protein CEK25_006558 [Fusarium fujikuroi]
MVMNDNAYPVPKPKDRAHPVTKPTGSGSSDKTGSNNKGSNNNYNAGSNNNYGNAGSNTNDFSYCFETHYVTVTADAPHCLSVSGDVCV